MSPTPALTCQSGGRAPLVPSHGPTPRPPQRFSTRTCGRMLNAMPTDGCPLPEGAAVKQVMETLIKRLRGAYRPSQDLYCVGHTMNLRAGDMGRFPQTSGAQNPSSTDYLVTSLLRRTHSERLTSHTHDVWCVAPWAAGRTGKPDRRARKLCCRANEDPCVGDSWGVTRLSRAPGCPSTRAPSSPLARKRKWLKDDLFSGSLYLRREAG